MRQTSQPGVLPLRPLTVGEVLDAAVSLLRTRPAMLVGLGAVAAAAEQAVLFPLRRLADVDLSYLPADDRWPQWALLVVVGFATESLIIAALGGPASSAAVRAVLGRSAPRPESGPRPVLAVAVVAVLVAVAGGVASVTIAGCVTLPVWIWVYGSLGLVVPVVVIERRGPLRAVRRSFALAHRGGRVLVVRPLAYVSWFAVRFAWGYGVLALVELVYVPPNTTMDNVLMAGVYLVVNAVAYPVLACLDAVLYLDARVRSEGLDIALRRDLHRGVGMATTMARL